MYVFNNSRPVGVLERSSQEADCYIFYYLPEAQPADAVSLMMPVMADPYTIRGSHLHPAFNANIPEGYLYDRLIRALRGATAYPDEYTVLQMVGHSVIGRLRFSEQRAPSSEPPELDLARLLARPGPEGLLDSLIDEYIHYCGVSGVQPKALVRASQESLPHHLTVRGTTHIVKSFDENEFPGLAENEYFCMRAAELAGLPVPQLTLSTDGKLLAVKRFDISADGQYLAFEDFGALYLMPSCDKYDSSYERIVKRIKELVSPANKAAALEEFFTSVVLSCAVRNGDAHLKNFGVLYTDPEKDVRLAPAFDIVCTQAYLPNDAMALTLNGSTRFPKHREIERFGRQICGLSAARVTGAIDAVCAAISQASIEMNAYASDHPEFAPLAGRMLECWEDGLNLSCRPDDRPLFMLALPEEDEGPGETELG